MVHNLRLLTWNANGLVRRQNELEVLLNSEQIDIALTSETHFTTWSLARIRGYQMHSCPHPSNRCRGGVAILKRDHIYQYESVRIQLPQYQVIGVTIQLPSEALTVASVYCQPRYQLRSIDYSNLLHQLGI